MKHSMKGLIRLKRTGCFRGQLWPTFVLKFGGRIVCGLSRSPFPLLPFRTEPHFFSGHTPWSYRQVEPTDAGKCLVGLRWSHSSERIRRLMRCKRLSSWPVKRVYLNSSFSFYSLTCTELITVIFQSLQPA